MARTEIVRRAKAFADQHGLLLGEELGSGVHGIVFATQDQTEGGRTAIKAHAQADFYVRERDIYLRLQRHNVTTVRGCNVPELLRHDDELFVLEMGDTLLGEGKGKVLAVLATPFL
jgi:hypothetical protein